MPRVPVSPGATVADSPLPGAYQSTNTSPDLLGSGGAQMAALGNATMGAAGEAQRIHYDLVEQGNALRVDDAINRATEAALRLQHDPKEGFTTQTGFAAVSRESGVPLADEYTQKLDKHVSDISATLSNDRQRQMFAMKANNIVTGFRGHAMTWETKEFQQYNLSTREATVSNAQNALTLNFADPENVALQTTRIRSAIMGGQGETTGVFIPGSAQMMGKSAAWASEKAGEAVSAAHERAVKTALEGGDVNLAMAYFKRYSGEMTAKDILGVRGTLQHDYDTRQGSAIGNGAIDAVQERLVPPTDFGRLTGLVMGQESGGRRFGADGKILTSSAGAKGEMQVMDGTNRDPGYGVRPAKDDSPDERARVGRDYLEAMIREYKGDLPKALAAYNGGPGRVDKAVKEAAKGGSKDFNWLSYMPKETQDYVAAISAKYSAGEGAPPRATLAEVHDSIRARMGPNASPLAVKTALETATARFTDTEKAVKQRSEETVTLAYQQLEKNGGRFSDLPTSTRDALSKLAPEKIDNVMNYASRVAKGDDVTNTAVYQKLSEPNALKALNDNQFYALKSELSEADFKHFANERSKLKNGNAPNGPGDLNSSAVKETLDQRLRELGIDPSPKSDGKEADARVGTIRRFVNDKVLVAQRDAGKKFNDAETVAFIDKLASTSVELKGWFGSTSKGPLFATKPGDIPSATRDKIKEALKRQGNDNPTDAQILNTFMQYSVSKK